MDDSQIKESWLNEVSKLDVCSEHLYTLMNPTDRKTFFELLDTIPLEHSIRVLGVKYLIVYEKEEKTTPISIPYTQPVDTQPWHPYPYVPSIPNTPNTDPYPWQLPQIWCMQEAPHAFVAKGPGPQVFYAVTNNGKA